MDNLRNSIVELNLKKVAEEQRAAQLLSGSERALKGNIDSLAMSADVGLGDVRVKFGIFRCLLNVASCYYFNQHPDKYTFV